MWVHPYNTTFYIQSSKTSFSFLLSLFLKIFLMVHVRRVSSPWSFFPAVTVLVFESLSTVDINYYSFFFEAKKDRTERHSPNG